MSRAARPDPALELELTATPSAAGEADESRSAVVAGGGGAAPETDAPRDPRALIFDRLAVRRMPGIDDGGYTLDGLAAGVNIIHGPNGSGKTTTARALESILWPRAASHPRAILAARCQLAGEEWSIEVDGQAARYQRDGRDASAPVLPPADARDRYHLSLHELLSADNRSFAEEIVRESAGGYDIARAAESLQTRAAASRRGREAEALEEARGKLGEAYAAVERLQQDERRLAELNTEFEAADAAAVRARLLERAAEYADAVAAEGEAVAAVAAFPEELALLRGDEADRLDQIRARLAEADRLLEQAEAARREAEAELREAGLGEGGGREDDQERASLGTGTPAGPLTGAGTAPAGLDDTTLDTLRARLDSLRAIEQAIAAKSRELEGARKLAAEELRRIGEVADETTLRGLDVVALDRLAGFAEEAGRVRAAQAAAEARLRFLADEPAAGEPDLERVGKGVHLLQQWLRASAGAGSETTARERRLRALGASAAGLLAGVGLAALILGLPADGAMAGAAAGAAPGSGPGAAPGLVLPIIALLLLLAGGVLLFLIFRPAPSAADPREVHRREYERLGLERPRSWTAEEVAGCLDRLEARRAHARLAEERAAERERVGRELETARADWVVLESRRGELAARYGVAPELDPAAFYLLANRISRWQDAEGLATERRAELEHLRGERAGELAFAARHLAVFGYGAVADLPGLAGAIEGLARRIERHRRATSELRHAENRAGAARKEIEMSGEERRAIFERVGLWDGVGGTIPAPGSPSPRDPESLVREWCALLPSYRQAIERRQGAEAVRRGAREKLIGTIGYEPGLEARGADELRAELDEARRLAAGAGELRDEIAGIRTRLDLARRGHAVEDALAEVERSEATLREARDRDILGVVGHALVEYLQRATRDEQRPAVFHRARELFALITRGRYRLEFEDGASPAFRAVDQTTSRGHSLDGLSSGTRVQLLLAVRIAFVESQESGVRLPLIFDETLGNSDDGRAAAIMEATVALAAEGRQVFYFTAQPDEVGKWQGVLARAAGVEWAVVDLAGARKLARYEAAPALPVVSPPEHAPPPPAGLSHAEYGQALLVPRVDLFADPGGIHLWHLVEDPALLHRLLTRRLESWGALRTLVEHGGEALLGDDAREIPRIRAAARALETALEIARIGRGRPVDRDVIEASGTVTATFMDRVAQLLGQVEGDAARLIEEIEGGALPRFQVSRREQLREYLEEDGYLDPREPVGPEELRARIFAEVAGEIAEGILEPGVVDRIIGRVHQRPDSITSGPDR